MGTMTDRVGLVVKRLVSRVAFCVAWASLCTAAGNAFGAIHYYYGDLSVPLGFSQTVDINFENDDFDDVVFENYAYPEGNYQGLYVPYSPGRIVGFQAASVEYVTNLSLGATIDATTLGSSYYGALSFAAEYPQAQFTSATDAFVGLAFPVGLDLHYSWVRVSVDNAAGTLLVKDWAFEDQPGVGITAGDTGTLPIYGDLVPDRNVNGFDFLAWQRGYPTTYTIFDYWLWEDNFGAGAGLTSPGLAMSVPEPVGLFPLLLGSAALLRRRKR